MKYAAIALLGLALSSCGSTIFIGEDGKVTWLPPAEPIVVVPAK